jgi:hypothetical protein
VCGLRGVIKPSYLASATRFASGVPSRNVTMRRHSEGNSLREMPSGCFRGSLYICLTACMWEMCQMVGSVWALCFRGVTVRAAFEEKWDGGCSVLLPCSHAAMLNLILLQRVLPGCD